MKTMNYILSTTTQQPIPANHNIPNIPLDGAGIGMIVMGTTALIVSILKGGQTAWKASQEIIEDLKKRIDDQEQTISDLKAENFFKDRQIRNLQRMMDLSGGLEMSNPPANPPRRY